MEYNYGECVFMLQEGNDVGGASSICPALELNRVEDIRIYSC